MSGYARRRAWARPEEDDPRVPDWLRPWLDPLSIEDLEIFDAGAAAREAGDDPAVKLAPAQRDRLAELETSYARFCEALA